LPDAIDMLAPAPLMQLRSAWGERSARDRAIIVVLALLVCAALYAWLSHTAWLARGKLEMQVAALRAQSARLDRHADEYTRLRAGPIERVSATDLRALVQSRTVEAGLSQALSRIESIDAAQVKVVFGAVPFADWLAWVMSLETQQVRVEGCRIEAMSAPGMVSVSATLTRQAG